ncbi:MAG: hypothetical protein Q8941_02975 [Bacteroidota bacterium]|nr:hypothetical protein [Bacteroidota bacterium]
MILHISRNKTLSETQEEFNKAYPFLRIEFYRNTEPGFARRHLKGSMPMIAAGLRRDGELEINDSMTVGQLEDTLLLEFGLHAQVSRQSGTLWLETTMTDNWTLKQQNDHGRELSEHIMINNITRKNDAEYD